MSIFAHSYQSHNSGFAPTSLFNPNASYKNSLLVGFDSLNSGSKTNKAGNQSGGDYTRLGYNKGPYFDPSSISNSFKGMTISNPMELLPSLQNSQSIQTGKGLFRTGVPMSQQMGYGFDSSPAPSQLFGSNIKQTVRRIKLNNS
jgi:hypothetical protein